MIDILKNSLNIQVIQSNQFIRDESMILTTSRGKRSTEHKINENLIDEIRMPIITNKD